MISSVEGASAAALLRAQVAAGRSFPYRLSRTAQVDLADAYVRQPPMPDGSSQRDADPGALVESVESALARHRHMVVTGGPGCNKPTMTLRLVDTTSATLIEKNRRASLMPTRELAEMSKALSPQHCPQHSPPNPGQPQPVSYLPWSRSVRPKGLEPLTF
ncbi:hypothetical protein AB0H28_26430 [Micromonospora sp. NPDC050980]|uniref:hypothetical protein n=1 Tax=Micromonospora sp. NPDC050980 TaxID=3155161 RepID=UPI003405A0CE